MNAESPINGVPLSTLASLTEAGRADRSTTEFSFAVTGTWAGGYRLDGTTSAATMGGAPDPDRAGRFHMTSDEPAPLGTDSGPNPVEYVLQGLAGCYTVTATTLAARRGITLDALHIQVTGDVDLAAFLDVDPDASPAVSEIRVEVDASSPDATREQLETLVADVKAASTVGQTLAQPVSVIATLK